MKDCELYKKYCKLNKIWSDDNMKKKSIQLTGNGLPDLEINLDEKVKNRTKEDILDDMLEIAKDIGVVLKRDKENRKEPNYQLLEAYTRLTNQILNYK